VKEKLEEFAEVLLTRSINVEKGDHVYLLTKSVDSLPLFKEVRKQIIQRGGIPHEHILYDSQLGAMDYTWMKHADKDQLETVSESKKKELEEMDAYIRIGGADNTKELKGIDSKKISVREKATKELLRKRLELDWVVTRYPTDGMSQAAEMPTEEFQKFVFDAVTEVDWDSLEEKNQKVKEIFDGAEEVRIQAEGTDLTLSLKNRDGMPCNGEKNMPDGEVFYAPVKDSLNGKVSFEYPGVTDGDEVEGIVLHFEDGKVVDYSAERNEELLKQKLNTDEGARYVGELGIGTNPEIQQFVKNTLFDEKIGGTIHLALGRAYEETVPEGEKANDSGIHWDIVEELRENGKITVDGEVVQENGVWKFEE
jgi:aminopeptidase